MRIACYWLITFLMIIAGYALAASSVFVSVFDKPPGGVTNGLWEWILSLEAGQRAQGMVIAFFSGGLMLLTGVGLAIRGTLLVCLRYLRAK